MCINLYWIFVGRKIYDGEASKRLQKYQRLVFLTCRIFLDIPLGFFFFLVYFVSSSRWFFLVGWMDRKGEKIIKWKKKKESRWSCLLVPWLWNVEHVKLSMLKEKLNDSPSTSSYITSCYIIIMTLSCRHIKIKSEHFFLGRVGVLDLTFSVGVGWLIVKLVWFFGWAVGVDVFFMFCGVLEIFFLRISGLFALYTIGNGSFSSVMTMIMIR